MIAACTHRDCVRALFSATLPEAVEGLARSVLKDPLRITVGERNTGETETETERGWVPWHGMAWHGMAGEKGGWRRAAREEAGAWGWGWRRGHLLGVTWLCGVNAALASAHPHMASPSLPPSAAAAVASVAQRLLFVGREEGKLLALRQLIGEGLRPPVLVFVATKDRAKELHRWSWPDA